jgi:hypothetical protein
MTRTDRIEWMEEWAARNGCTLDLEGECGLGRECVGVVSGGLYPDYEWYDGDYDRIDPNGYVHVPHDAYHKHPCVAVLGRGEHAEAQLYDWLRWFESNGFVVEVSPVDQPGAPLIAVQQNIFDLFNPRETVRMVKQPVRSGGC